MCGIFGYIARGKSLELLSGMGQLLSHRGPDDAGYYSNNELSVYFGLRRLSIIDLEGGHQPISNEDNTVWIACNGEIYNYLELREDLLKQGHQFRTHSDVEVLVHLYEDKGLDFLDDVNGMFGIVLFDAAKNRLIIARDRLGIKPVYYSWNGKELAFASEIKPILFCPWMTREPDWQAISAYLHLLYVPSPGTGFKNVHKLASGTMAILEKGNLRFKSYWELSAFLNTDTKMSAADATDHLQYLLKDACQLQLRSDVPVGAFLSGGVDSSAVVALTNKDHVLNMDTFTVSWKQAAEKMDETPFARSVADRYDCDYHECQISFDDFDRLLPLLAWHMEEPCADGAYVPTYVISQFARKRSKVMLSGAGGDELFGGYGWYNPASFFPNAMKQILFPELWKRHSRVFSGRAFLFPWKFVFPSYTAGTAHDFLTAHSQILSAQSSCDLLNAQMTLDLGTFLQDDVLLITDKMSMAASLETRVPLLDHRIAEFVSGLPSCYKISKSGQKIIFKKSVESYLPREILYRKKDGFGAPINSWMQGNLKTISLDLLKRGQLMKLGIINTKSIERLTYLIKMKKEWAWSIWILLNLELWFAFVLENAEKPVGVCLSDL